MSFNLIATTFRGSEREASSELYSLLGEAGDPSPEVRLTNVSGLIVSKTVLSPYECVEKIRNLLAVDPWRLRYLQRVIPVDVVVSTDLGEISSAAKRLVERIGESSSFRVTVEKRFTNIPTKDFIEAVASVVERRVDLTNPEWVILVEVIGKDAALSVLRQRDILSIPKEKRGKTSSDIVQ